jgi:prepilin-type N-terminal cleavage/methylation domain-containing protein
VLQLRAARDSFANRAFSLLELLIAIVVIGILAVLVISGFSMMKARAQRIQCTANLKSLYVAAESDVQQKGSWPQILRSSFSTDEAYAQAWVAELKPFGPSEKTWICPTIENLVGNVDYIQPQNARIDYIPMHFDTKEMTPHRWPDAPWFIEVGDMHGNGQLIIFTDGSIRDVNTILQAAGSPPPSS